MPRFAPLFGLLLALPLGAGCSVIADFGRYTADGGRRDGSLDGCEPACTADQACCEGSCAPLGTIENCGACGDACAAGMNASATCDPTCGLACNLGFDDCNDDPSDGCEAGLGTPETCGDCATSCPGTLCADGVCVDMCPAGQTECSGSCFVVGEACSCVAGSGAGSRVCDPATNTVTCSYPDETCNGLDDDCDTVADNGFDCVAGGSHSCAVAIGTCTANGTSMCDMTCGLGACIVSEVCNRADDTCDDFVDEGSLMTGAATRGPSATEPRGVWNPVDNEVGVIFTYADGLFFTRLAPDGTPTAGAVTLTLGVTGGPGSDIAWDGVGYLVAYPRGPAVEVLRVDPATGMVATSFSLPPSPATMVTDVRVAMIGATSQAVVVWTDNWGASYATLHLPPPVGATPRLVDMGVLNRASAIRSPFAVTTSDGAVIGYSQTDSSVLGVHTLHPGGVSTRRPHPIGFSDYATNIEAAYDATNNVVGLVYRNMRPPMASCVGATFVTLDDGLNEIWRTMVSTTTESRVAIASGADEAFGVYVQDVSVSEIRRYRARDGEIYADTLPSGRAAAPSNLVGIGGTNPVRYLALAGAGPASMLNAQPVQCR